MVKETHARAEGEPRRARGDRRGDDGLNTMRSRGRKCHIVVQSPTSSPILSWPADPDRGSLHGLMDIYVRLAFCPRRL